MARRKTITVEYMRAEDLHVGDVLCGHDKGRVVLEIWSTTMPAAKVKAEASEYVQQVLNEIDSRYVLILLGWASHQPRLADGQPHRVMHFKYGGSDPTAGLAPPMKVWRLAERHHLYEVQLSHEVYTAEPHVVDRYLPGDVPPLPTPLDADRLQYRLDNEDEVVEVQVFRSRGSDDAIVVQIDTPEVLGDDREFLRINVNDAPIWGVPYKPKQDRYLD